MTNLRCDKHGIELECLGGCSAHRDNWYCPKCDKEKVMSDKVELAKEITDIVTAYSCGGYFSCVDFMKDVIPKIEQLAKMVIDENSKPLITNKMKAECIGRFFWEEKWPYYDEDGNYHNENILVHIVPWDLCKDIFKKMNEIRNQ